MTSEITTTTSTELAAPASPVNPSTVLLLQELVLTFKNKTAHATLNGEELEDVDFTKLATMVYQPLYERSYYMYDDGTFSQWEVNSALSDEDPRKAQGSLPYITVFTEGVATDTEWGKALRHTPYPLTLNQNLLDSLYGTKATADVKRNAATYTHYVGLAIYNEQLVRLHIRNPKYASYGASSVKGKPLFCSKGVKYVDSLIQLNKKLGGGGIAPKMDLATGRFEMAPIEKFAFVAWDTTKPYHVCNTMTGQQYLASNMYVPLGSLGYTEAELTTVIGTLRIMMATDGVKEALLQDIKDKAYATVRRRHTPVEASDASVTGTAVTAEELAALQESVTAVDVSVANATEIDF
jgi:hypothetical protein